MEAQVRAGDRICCLICSSLPALSLQAEFEIRPSSVFSFCLTCSDHVFSCPRYTAAVCCCAYYLRFSGERLRQNKVTNTKLPEWSRNGLFTVLIFGWFRLRRLGMFSLLPSFSRQCSETQIHPRSDELSKLTILSYFGVTDARRLDLVGVWGAGIEAGTRLCLFPLLSSLACWGLWFSSPPRVSHPPATVACFPSEKRHPPACPRSSHSPSLPCLINAFPRRFHRSFLVDSPCPSLLPLPLVAHFPSSLLSFAHAKLCRVHGDGWDVFPSLLSSGLEIKRWR